VGDSREKGELSAQTAGLELFHLIVSDLHGNYSSNSILHSERFQEHGREDRFGTGVSGSATKCPLLLRSRQNSEQMDLPAGSAPVSIITTDQRVIAFRPCAADFTLQNIHFTWE
jgi:hypothetical protein